MDIEQVFDRHHDTLMAIPNVEGVGVGEKDGQPAIVVLAKQVTPEVTSRVPKALEGVPVVLEQSGEIVAF